MTLLGCPLRDELDARRRHDYGAVWWLSRGLRRALQVYSTGATAACASLAGFATRGATCCHNESCGASEWRFKPLPPRPGCCRWSMEGRPQRYACQAGDARAAVFGVERQHGQRLRQFHGSRPPLRFRLKKAQLPVPVKW